MSFEILVPNNAKKLIRGIESLKWQIEQEADEKSKEIFIKTLELYEKQLNKLQEQD